MLKNQWDAELYESKHAFVWQSGESLIELLSPQPEEQILDLGCGTGQLTQQIAIAHAQVIGIDRSSTMIETAQQNYPHLKFLVADAQNFQADRPFDAVFSNAVLHWIPNPDGVIHSVYQALKPGGRFVAEFGGKGNVQAIVQALYRALETINSTPSDHWYFPSIAEYTTRLEQQGFDVTYAVLFDRPTPLAGEDGLSNWLQMFASRFLEKLPDQERSQVIRSVEQDLKPTLYQTDHWTADYRRLRVVAVKRGN
ncbi:class I SAM-dependent methyltransferase [Phormidesmis priestleyi]